MVRIYTSFKNTKHGGQHYYDIDEITGCWNWFFLQKSGYGSAGGFPAHRVMYKIKYGDIPDGLDLDHLCKNRACVNPEHLEPVTRKENINRTAVTKLSNEEVEAIKGSIGKMKQLDVAKIFNINQSHVSRIWNGKRRNS